MDRYLTDLAQTIRRELLPRVQKPARYIGGEWNEIHKDPKAVACRFALAFPDVYEIGISYPGYKILYELINALPGVYAERVYSPWPDMEELLRTAGLPVTSLETGTPLGQFDLVGITLQHELSYTNVLNLLALGRIPLEAAERTDAHPLVLAGGPGAANPEPLAPALDLVVVGDGEEVVPELLARFAELKGRPRAEKIRALSAIPGVYAPARYRPVYGDGGTFQRMEAEPGAPLPVLRRTAAAPPLPRRPLVPFLSVPQDRITTELFRGCLRGCRFCQAGMITRPVRERDPEDILEQVLSSVDQTGYEEVSLISLSSGDYTQILPLVRRLMPRLLERQVALSFPSLRLDSFRNELAETVRRVRKTGLTFAPEAGSARLRAVLNKCYDEASLAGSVAEVFREGWDLVKLYFMVGLPTETDADVAGIADLVREILGAARKIGTGARPPRLHVSVALFVPKPNTPFQWVGQLPAAEAAARLTRLMQMLPKNVQFHFGKKEQDDLDRSLIEAVLARGDRRLWPAVKRAWELGARFDSWGEHFRFETWQRALRETGIDAGEIALRERDLDEPMPWEHIAAGVTRAFLRREWERSRQGAPTPDCRAQGPCQGCGASDPAECPPPPAKALAPESPAAPPARAPEREIVRVRFRYRKAGDMRFVGHLDLVNLFRRAARRARLPLHYSRGFHPQPELSFGPPLPLGFAGLGEWMDIGLDTWRDPKLSVAALNQALPAGLEVEAGREVPLSTPSLAERIDAGEYRLELPLAAPARERTRLRVREFLEAKTIMAEQWSKAGPRQVNLRPAVGWLKVVAEDDAGLTLAVLHHAPPGGAKMPTLVEGLCGDDLEPWRAAVTRVASGVWTDQGLRAP